MALNRREFLGAAVASTLVASQAKAVLVPAKFKLGLVTYNVAQNWDLPTLLRNASEAGVAAVECRTTHKHGVEPKLTADQRATVKKQFADAGVVFWGCGSVCEFHAADRAEVTRNVEECKQFLALVNDLGGRGVKVRPNGVGKGQTVEQACDQIGTALKLCGSAAADLGLEIWVEVHGATTQVPKNMKAIMDACGNPAVGVTWNSNPTDLVNGTLAEGFKLLEPHIKSCHVNELTNDAAGKYPYRELFARLAGMNYDRYTLCEVGKSVEPAKGVEYLREYKKLWTSLLPK